MKILSIDTSSNICGVSILKNDNLICNLDSNTGKTHSENLMPMINNALTITSLQVKDFDLIVCDIGPGSFTGIRIGVATAKAFVDSFNIPCVGISSLEALAYNLKKNVFKDRAKKNLICSMIDCKNDNCYFALFEENTQTIETLINPQAGSVESALSILNSYCTDTLSSNLITFVGDGSQIYKDKIISTFSTAKFADTNLNILNSYSLGLAGLNKYNSGFDACDILPLYLKKPQAQRQLEERLSHNN